MELLEDGYEVYGISRSKDKLTTLETKMNHPLLHLYPCDVSDLSSVKKISFELKNKNITPQLLFLNAGIAGKRAMEPLDKLETSIHRDIFAVNYYGVLNFVEQWLAPCDANGGATFIVSSSINAIFSPPSASAYSASKAAISKAFDGLRLTHAGSNLKFLNIFCGPVNTPGLVGKLPFTWHPQKMAKYIIKNAKRGKSNSYPSKFYLILAKLLNIIPTKYVSNLMGGS